MLRKPPNQLGVLTMQGRVLEPSQAHDIAWAIRALVDGIFRGLDMKLAVFLCFLEKVFQPFLIPHKGINNGCWRVLRFVGHDGLDKLEHPSLESSTLCLAKGIKVRRGFYLRV